MGHPTRPVSERPDAESARSDLLAPAVIIMTVSQAVVVVASLAAPVLAKTASERYGVEGALIGGYTALIFAAAIPAALICPAFVGRWGPTRCAQASLLLAALGLLFACIPSIYALAPSALAIGFAYGPANPASSALLRRVTPPRLRSKVFSLKQVSVPLGGFAVGLASPWLLHRVGWSGALAVLAGLAVMTAIAIQPWRRSLDAARSDVPERGFLAGLYAPLRLIFGRADLARLALTSCGFAAMQFTFGAVCVVMLVDRGGFSLAGAGAVLSTAMAFSIVLRIASGFAADSIGGRATLAIFGVVMALGAWCFAAMEPSWPGPLSALAAVVLGTACFSWNGVYLAEVASVTDAATVADATAGCMTMTFLGGLAGPAFFSAVALASGGAGKAFSCFAVIVLVASASLVWAGRRPRQAPAE
ncbi:MFS transporter [Hansschlegelia sp. KR7-227]|uniref:MFS transporter n=1 Tax=Hansschlegelia sp. KR7-227 TaxID=3400914 RepID=UPI003C0A5AF7